MNDNTLNDARQQLAKIHAQLAAAGTVLARIRAQGDSQHVEKEARTRQLIEDLSAQAEALAQQLGGNAARVLH